MAKRDARLLLGFSIKREIIYKEKPKTFFQELFGLQATKEKCGYKDYYSCGKVIIRYIEISYRGDWYSEYTVGSESYNLSEAELNKLLNEREDRRRKEIEDIKRNII